MNDSQEKKIPPTAECEMNGSGVGGEQQIKPVSSNNNISDDYEDYSSDSEEPTQTAPAPAPPPPASIPLPQPLISKNTDSLNQNHIDNITSEESQSSASSGSECEEEDEATTALATQHGESGNGRVNVNESPVSSAALANTKTQMMQSSPSSPVVESKFLKIKSTSRIKKYL